MGFEVKSGILKKYKEEHGITNIIIPDSVTHIGNYAFSGCKSLEKITIPNSVTSIGEEAFSSCYSLSSINIPDSITNIDRWAFSFCYALTSVDIPDSVTNIGECAFYCCKALTSVKISDRVTIINNSLFSECGCLTNVTISDKVTEICERAFHNCINLVNITIPDSVTSIGTSAFKNCSTLTEINIPYGMTKINNYSFYHCSSIKSVTIPDSVTSIGERAFSGCNSLTEIYISNSVAEFGWEPFSDCNILVDNSGFIILNNVLLGYTGKADKVKVPDGITEIKLCSMTAKDVHLPDSVRKIELSSRAYKTKYSLPQGFLQQTDKLDSKTILELLNHQWGELATVKDWSALYLYQSDKKIKKLCEEYLSSNTENAIAAMSELIDEKGIPANYKIIAAKEQRKTGKDIKEALLDYLAKQIVESNTRVESEAEIESAYLKKKNRALKMMQSLQYKLRESGYDYSAVIYLGNARVYYSQVNNQKDKSDFDKKIAQAERFINESLSYDQKSSLIIFHKLIDNNYLPDVSEVSEYLLSSDCIVAPIIACYVFITSDVTAEIEFTRDKWDGRGDYEGMGGPLYRWVWKLSSDYPNGRCLKRKSSDYQFYC